MNVRRSILSMFGRRRSSASASVGRPVSEEAIGGRVDPGTGGTGTLNHEEVDKFRALKSEWWDRNGPLKALHSMNKLRVPLVRDGLVATGMAEEGTAEPLAGLCILDVGCGGGILTERLARIGASVTAVDAAEENVAAASLHSSSDPVIAERISYVAGTVESFVRDNPDKKFHAVVASEILEHVDNQADFISSCASLLEDGGSLFVTTLNRTQLSYWTAIVGAEYILGILPRGTHDWNKFVKPSELKVMLEKAGCIRTRLVHGMFYFPVLDKWTWVSDTSVNFAIHAIKGA